jgi:hypothetical protein
MFQAWIAQTATPSGVHLENDAVLLPQRVAR